MLDALTLDQMRTFVAVAEAGSFRGGGAKLARVQSAVSHAIGSLETQLGLLLFDRTSHRPTLTSEGRSLLEDVRAILLKVDLLRAKALGLGEGVEVELSLLVDTLFPIAIVADALKEMRGTFPSVGIRLRIGTLGEPVQALNNRECDIAITVGHDIRSERLEFESLSSLSFVAVVSADHPLANFTSVGSAELADHLQIVLEDPSILSRGRDYGVLSPHTWRVTGQDAKLAFIRAGVGWGRLPLWAVQTHLRDGSLVRLSASALGQHGEVLTQAYLARRIDQPLLPAARVFRERLMTNVELRRGEF